LAEDFDREQPMWLVDLVRQHAQTYGDLASTSIPAMDGAATTTVLITVSRPCSIENE
jgi:hypothetical protein